MKDQMESLPNYIKFVQQGESVFDSTKVKSIFETEEFQNYSSNRMQEQLGDLVKVPDFTNLINTKAEQDKHLTDRMDNTNKLLEQSNQIISELQLKLEESCIQLHQANDKIAIQTSLIESLKTDLKIESLKSEAAEGKLSSKDWKVTFVGLACAVIVLGIEHWRFVLNLISSLFV